MNINQFKKSKIPTIEIFNSVSGEGITAGTVMTFVRVAGCNLRCSYCDTTYSYDETNPNNQHLAADDIIKVLNSYKCKNILCTGGEPLELNKPKRYLPLYIASKGFNVRIETNGSYPVYTKKEINEFLEYNEELCLNYALDFKCPDSGMSNHNICEENLRLLRSGDEVKFIVGSQGDLDYSSDIIHSYKELLKNSGVVINFSPVFGKIDTKDIVNFMKGNNPFFEENNLRVRLSLQIHKFIWPPETRGV